MTGYETFKLYLALKNHFTQDKYDFFKYNGKTSATQETFLGRRDRFQFEKLARKIQTDEMRDFIVANVMAGNTWVGDMLTTEADETFRNYLKIKQSLTYTVENDVDRALKEVDSPKELFMFTGDLPPIASLAIREEISLETFVILNALVGFIPKFNERLEDHYLWEKLRDKAVKYAPFVQFDKQKMANILKEKLTT